MDRYAEFFLTAPRDVRPLDLIEITHPDFTKDYRLVRNARHGLTLDIDGVEQTFDFFPLRIRKDAASDDIGTGLSLDVGDLGEEIPDQVRAVRTADGMQVKPMLRYWVFRSDDLTQPILGPLTYEVKSVSSTDEGSTLRAVAPELDKTSTGEAYTLERFPMLRGVL